MGFPGLFAIGLSGVNAYSASLEAVSNNIANTQTTGYKRVQTDFSTLIQGEAPEGGLNGGGVQGVNRQLVTEQGAITRTNSATDLAVSGDGFFVVSETADGNACHIALPLHPVRRLYRAGRWRADERSGSLFTGSARSVMMKMWLLADYSAWKPSTSTASRRTR